MLTPRRRGHVRNSLTPAESALSRTFPNDTSQNVTTPSATSRSDSDARTSTVDLGCCWLAAVVDQFPSCRRIARTKVISQRITATASTAAADTNRIQPTIESRLRLPPDPSRYISQNETCGAFEDGRVALWTYASTRPGKARPATVAATMVRKNDTMPLMPRTRAML